MPRPTPTWMIRTRPAVQSFSQKWNAYFSKPGPNLALRLVVLLLGYAFVALGVAVSRSTGLGVSPISAIPNVLSFALPQLTIGMWTFVFSILLIVLQWVMLKEKFSKVQFLQLPLSVVFSAFIDLFVPLAEMIPQPNYIANLAVIVLSIFIMAVGVFLEVRAALIPLPGEGIGTALNAVTGWPFPRCKLTTDTTNVAIGVLISFLTMGVLMGVREGTIIIALSTGHIVRLYGKLLPNFSAYVPTKGLWEIQQGGM